MNNLQEALKARIEKTIRDFENESGTEVTVVSVYEYNSIVSKKRELNIITGIRE